MDYNDDLNIFSLLNIDSMHLDKNVSIFFYLRNGNNLSKVILAPIVEGISTTFFT